MNPELAGWIVAALVAYLAAGAAFAIVFVTRGVARIDPSAEQMRWTVRVLVFPGATLLWPLMLSKWFKQRRPPLA